MTSRMYGTSRPYGASVATLVPWSLGPHGLKRSVEMALAAGYDGVQALPLRGWDYKKNPEWEHRIISYEDAWNYGPLWNLWKVLLRHLGIKPEAPTILDWLLFGRKKLPYFPAIFCSHDWTTRPNAVTEIYPDLSINLADYARFCNSGGGVCVDTFHILRGQGDGGPRFSSWMGVLSSIPDEGIRLIHVHIPTSEISPFVDKRRSLTTEILAYLKRRCLETTPAIVEIAPPMASRANTIKVLREVREAALYWLG